MYEPVDEIRAVDIKRAGDWTDLHFDDGGMVDPAFTLRWRGVSDVRLTLRWWGGDI